MMLHDKLKNNHIILASQSPRRQMLLEGLGLEFEILPADVEEIYPAELRHFEIAVFLSELKANAFDLSKLCDNCLIITADTLVWKDDQILLKPKDDQDARQILRNLSGEMHEVITGVTLRTRQKMKTFHVITKVFFNSLTDEEIRYYVSHYHPFDKAGAYGAQDWIGYVGIEKIEGCYFNVVGLPVQQLWKELNDFLN
jgi:septum formation protein